MTALSSLCLYLCNSNAITHNPATGVARPKGASGEIPALSDDQARKLLDAPDTETLKGKRDMAILSALLYHGIRRAELCALRIRDVTERRGVKFFTIRGKGSKTRYISARPATLPLIEEYLSVISWS